MTLWVVLGVMVVVGGRHLMVRPAPPESPREAKPESPREAKPVTVETDSVPGVGGQTAAVPETSMEPGEDVSRPASAQLKASAPLGGPVYIGHTDRVALQPGMVRALRQLVDTSHDGLQVKTDSNGVKIVETVNKFRHVAVAVITPDGKIVQQDISTAP